MSAGNPPGGGPVFGGGDDDDVSPGTAPGVAPNQDLEDLYMVRVGLDTGDMQAGARAIASQLRDITGETTRQTTSLTKGFAKLNKLARLFGVALTPMGIATELLKIDEATAGVRKSMYETTREATMGGGAVMQWARNNQQAFTTYLSHVEEMRSKLRVYEDDSVQIFEAVARSGVASFQDLSDSSEERINSIVKTLSEMTELGFELKFLGLSPKQIETMFHSMATNLRMDSDEIRTSLHQFYLTVDESALTWQEHTGYVARAFEQYSKFGIGLQEVHQYLLLVGQDAARAADGFQNIGQAYEIAMRQMGVRDEISMDRAPQMMQMLQQGGALGDIVGEGATRDLYSRRLGQMQRGLPAGQQVTLDQLLDPEANLSMLQLERAWTAFGPSQMNMGAETFLTMNLANTGQGEELRRRLAQAVGFTTIADRIRIQGIQPQSEVMNQYRAGRDADTSKALLANLWDQILEAAGTRGVTEEMLAGRDLPVTAESYLTDPAVQASVAKEFFSETTYDAMGKQREQVQGIRARIQHVYGEVTHSVMNRAARKEMRDRELGGQDIDSVYRAIMRGDITNLPRDMELRLRDPVEMFDDAEFGGRPTTIDQRNIILQKLKRAGLDSSQIESSRQMFYGGALDYTIDPSMRRAPEPPSNRKVEDKSTSMGGPGVSGDGPISMTVNLHMGPNEMITFYDLQTKNEYKNRVERSRAGVS